MSDTRRPSVPRLVLVPAALGIALFALPVIGLVSRAPWSDLASLITDPAPRMPRPLVAARIQLSSAVRVWRLPHIKGLELDGFPRRYPAAYSRLVKDVDAMPRATAHVG